MTQPKSGTREFLFSLGVALLLVMSVKQPGSNGRAKEVLTPQAMVYYVAPSGKDSNPGTANQPWHTVQKAAKPPETIPNQFSSVYWASFIASPLAFLSLFQNGL